MDVLAHRIQWEQKTSKSTEHTLGPFVPTKQERNQKKRTINAPHKRTVCTAQDKTFPWTFNIFIKPIYLHSPPETTRATLIVR